MVADGEAEIIVVQRLNAWSEDLAAPSIAPRQQQDVRELGCMGIGRCMTNISSVIDTNEEIGVVAYVYR